MSRTPRFTPVSRTTESHNDTRTVVRVLGELDWMGIWYFANTKRGFSALCSPIEVSKFWLITIDHFPSTKFHAPRSSVPRLLIFLSPDIRSLSGARECRRSFLHTIARTRVQGHSRAPTHSSSSRSPAPQACIAVHSSQGSLFSSLAYTLMARCP